MSTSTPDPKENITGNLTDAPASQPEVAKLWKEEVNSKHKPSQAEGDRATVEADLAQKDRKKSD